MIRTRLVDTRKIVLRVLRFSDDAKLVAAYSPDDHFVRVWNVSSGIYFCKLRARGCKELSFSADATALLVEFGNGALWVVNVLTARKQCMISRFTIVVGHGWPEELTPAALSPDATMIVVGRLNCKLELLDATTGSITRTICPPHFLAHTDVWSVVFSPDGKMIASVSTDDVVRVWCVQTEKLLRALSGLDRTTTVAFSPDCTSILTSSWHSLTKLWSITNGGRNRVFRSDVPHEIVSFARFSPDGTVLLTKSLAGLVHLWNVDSEAHVRTLSAPQNAFPTVFSLDGAALIRASPHGNVRKRFTTWFLKPAIHAVRPLLQCNLPPYVVLEIVNWILAAEHGVAFEVESQFAHRLKIRHIVTEHNFLRER